ncbi:AAA family ATPase [Bacillus cereus]|uniref:AAA family ATPase n=1 Tax=Bacillus cereus TaxID=1396 RepID=UPI000BF46207|nr:AAA family ATPase [Bacillus cereus]PFC37726.1 hypothetical protein CN310_14145 [Bacillus cereus]PFQ73019.1 hypothetical protein COK15_26225 [Bacillus cereus]PFU08884.1 hypothetical protein COK79_24715 [Bacillus cereus]PGY73680.1 hypothetical protein COE34_02940 [Bacillus cereus]
MEICYYWIDKFGVIEEQGYNFGSQLNFKYKDNVLTIEENKLYIKGFFNHDNSNRIKNITAICGENGVGKSTFLRAFKDLLRDCGITPRKIGKVPRYSKRILVIKLAEKYKIIFHRDLFSVKNVEYKGRAKNKYANNIEFISYGDGKNMHKFNRQWRVDGTEILSDISCVYFSHAFDNNFYNDTSNWNRGYIDISTKGLLNKIEVKLKPFNSFRLGADQPNHLKFRDDRFYIGLLKEFYITETKKRINLLEDEKSRGIIRKHNFFPKNVELNLDYIVQRRDSNIDEMDSSKLLRSEGIKQELNKIELYIYSYIERMHNSTHLRNFSKSALLVLQTYLRRIMDSYFNDVERFLYFKLKNLKKIFKNIDDNELKNKDIQELLDFFLQSVTREVKKIILNNDSYSNFNEEEFKKLTQSYKDFIEFFSNELLKESLVIKFKDSMIQMVDTKEDGDPTVEYRGVKTIAISLNPEIESQGIPKGINLLQRIIESYEAINTTSNFIKIEWEGLSTGEDTLLSIYSRFFNLKLMEQQEGKSLLKNNVIILLDEIEHSLHPEWQRTLLNKLIEYLSYVFSNCNSIQIVLATNVPFLIADIPTRNIIYLEKFEEEVKDIETGKIKKKIEVGISEKMKLSNQTFAANIHSLLMNNFFMNSTLGEFSEKKIKAIIKDLKAPLEGEQRKTRQEEAKKYFSPEEIKTTIQTIGEPIIKNKLEAMYSEKYGKDIREIEIKRLISEFQESEKDIPDKINSLLNEILRKSGKDFN